MAPRAGWQDKIKAYLAKHPGSTARQIADALKHSRPGITDALGKLRTKGAVEHTEDGPLHPTVGTPQFVFYLTGEVSQEAPEQPEDEMDQRVVAPEPPKEGETWHDKIVAYVRANPGKTNIEISEGIGYDRMNVSSSTVNLWRQGVFVRAEGPRREGRGNRMQPLYFMKGQAPEGVTLMPLTGPKPRKTTVDRYNEAVRAAQEAAEEADDIEEDDAEDTDEGEQEAEEDASIARYEAQRVVEPAPVTHPITQGFDAAIDKLASIIAERIIERALENIEMRLDQHLSPSRAPKSIEGLGDLYSKPAERNGKPSALVVGLLPQQQALLQSDYHRAVKLTFFKDGNLKLLQQKAQSVEHVLVVCDFVSHATTDALKGHKDKLQLLRGGMSTVRDALGAIVTGA